MTDLTQYTKDAVRTESKIDAIIVNETLLLTVMQQMIALGSVLDQIKKHAFYGKQYNFADMAQHIGDAEKAFKAMKTLTKADIVEDEKDVNINPRIFHAVIGMATESVELLDALRFWGTRMDTINMLEEIGDMSWYQAILVDTTGASWDDILDRNIEKLQKRFPEKFTTADAIGRDTVAERKVLDKIKTKDE